uniref:Uncharacterized protein n=1 Tax=Salarias fasciatus TaxID=181472 RepID=A0A672IV12_SALFA
HVFTTTASISTPSTPVCFPHSTPAARQSCCLVVTPMTFPNISDSARLWTSTQNIPRLNPLHPPMVHKRTVSLETPAVHHHNHQRTLIISQVLFVLFDLKSHHQVPSGIQVDKNNHFSLTSLCVSQQLSTRVQEAEHLQEVDRLALSSEREQRIRHSKAMSAYRDENKRLMEQSWRDRALTRSQEALKERELLRLNPINWSGTLK